MRQNSLELSISFPGNIINDSMGHTVAAVNPGHVAAAEFIRLFQYAPEVRAALSAIMDFCDDPNGSDKEESLAIGLARLLPAAREAIGKSGKK